MRFTLVVMTYDRPEALGRCLRSIAALRYDRDAYETVVVDDGSPPPAAEKTRATTLAHGASYHTIPHQGVAAARNAGLERARGEYVAFIADDNALPPDYLLQADELFARYPDAEVVTFNMRSCGSSPARHVQQLYLDLVLHSNSGAEPDGHGVVRSFTLPASRCAVFRRATLVRLGGFDANLRSGEDGELGGRLAAQGIPVYWAPGLLVDHWEDKSFAQFLDQRRRYATSFYQLWSRAHPELPRPHWTRRRALQMVASRLGPWFGLSWRRGLFVRYLALLPGLAWFLGRFYWTLHELERRELAASRS